jgi:hypothetical protein
VVAVSPQQEPALPEVTFLEEFRDPAGNVWRLYERADTPGIRTTVHTRAPGFRRKASRESTDRRAALNFAGYL